MPVALAALVFIVGTIVSLSTGWLLVSRLERLGERLAFSGALLGIVAALAADAPEITSAVTALAHREQRVGAGIVIGSNVFNLATLLGLGALVAGQIALHRRVVILSGLVALGMAAICFAAILGLVSPMMGLFLSLVVLLPYVVVLGVGATRLRAIRLPSRWVDWLGSAIAEEELELGDSVHPGRGGARDALVAGASLLVVVGASVAMERAASFLGDHYAVPGIVLGGLVLAAVTSLPNAVAAIYLARRGMGAAVLSTALNSNALNVAVGLLIPATVVGLGKPSGPAVLIAAWYVGLTAFSLVFAYRDCGLRRDTGALIIGGYLVFLGSVLASTPGEAMDVRTAIVPAAVTGVVFCAWLVMRRGRFKGGKSSEPAPQLRS